jgi:hypothetical protein
MIDRTHPKIVVVCYPAGAGGNFLINCLSLSDQCVLRNKHLAARQLQGQLTSHNKLEFFYAELDDSLETMKWNDLGVTNIDFFGVAKTVYLEEYAEMIGNMFDPIVDAVIGAGKYIFIVCHTTQYLEAYKKFWPNAKVVVFTEYHKFVQQRGYNNEYQTSVLRLQNYWQAVKGVDWPNNPPMNHSDLSNLPLFIKEELMGQFRAEILTYLEFVPTRQILHDQAIDLGIKTSQYFVWDVKQNYSGNQEIFLANLHACAKWLGIELKIDDQQLVKFYLQWLDTIFQLVSQPYVPE